MIEMEGIYTWQYNGAAPWKDIWSWCQDNLEFCWTNGYENIHFDDEKEYTWFLLKWA